MEKVYRIFISSTFNDLPEERKHVSNMLSKAGYFVAGMELFPATDQQQLDYIYRVIDRCDYYVVIIAGRYGSTSDDGFSYTEKEFEYARSKGLPILAFIHGNPSGIEVGKTDQDAEKFGRLNAFKRTLQSGRLIDYWTEINQLAANVVIAVSNATNLAPGVGWVRGDQAIDPKIIQELELLRTENSRLKSIVADSKFGEMQFPDHLAGPSDSIGITIRAVKADRRPNDPIYENQTAIVLVGDLFRLLYSCILKEPSEYQLERQIGEALAQADKDGRFQRHSLPSLDRVEVETLRFHFEALGLIQAIGRVEHSEGHATDYIAWTITEKGRRFVALSAGIRKGPASNG